MYMLSYIITSDMIAIYRASIHNIMYVCIYVQIASYVHGCYMLYSNIMQVAPV